jgi:hypothetical protein
MIIKYKHRTENVEIPKELKELKNIITLPQQHLQIMLSSWVTIVNGVFTRFPHLSCDDL